MSIVGRSAAQCRQFAAARAAVGTPLLDVEIFMIEALGGLHTLITNLETQIGAFIMATQADVDALTQQIQDLNTKWKAWADNVVTILGNVETALTNAEQANGISLDAAKSALTDGQTAVGNLPVETDPTVAPPAPAPTPAPNAGS